MRDVRTLDKLSRFLLEPWHAVMCLRAPAMLDLQDLSPLFLCKKVKNLSGMLTSSEPEERVLAVHSASGVHSEQLVCHSKNLLMINMTSQTPSWCPQMDGTCCRFPENVNWFLRVPCVYQVMERPWNYCCRNHQPQSKSHFQQVWKKVFFLLRLSVLLHFTVTSFLISVIM